MPSALTPMRRSPPRSPRRGPARSSLPADAARHAPTIGAAATRASSASFTLRAASVEGPDEKQIRRGDVDSDERREPDQHERPLIQLVRANDTALISARLQHRGIPCGLESISFAQLFLCFSCSVHCLSNLSRSLVLHHRLPACLRWLASGPDQGRHDQRGPPEDEAEDEQPAQSVPGATGDQCGPERQCRQENDGNHPEQTGSSGHL